MAALTLEPLRGDTFRSIDPDGWYTVAQVAELCQVHRLTVIRWITGGKLKATKQAGVCWRVLGASIIATAPGIHTAPPMREETPKQRDRRAAEAMKRITRGVK